MKVKLDYRYELGILAGYDDSYDYKHFDDDGGYLEVDVVILDTANNPTKTTKIFALEYSWSERRVRNWVRERMNNV